MVDRAQVCCVFVVCVFVVCMLCVCTYMLCVCCAFVVYLLGFCCVCVLCVCVFLDASVRNASLKEGPSVRPSVTTMQKPRFSFFFGHGEILH